MKKTVLWIILDLIFLIIFNALFFVLGGTEHNVSVWMSYGFIHFAYIMLVATPFLVRGGKSKAIFGFSLLYISSGYFFLQFIAGIIFILFAPESINAPLLVQLCIAGLYGIILVANMIANERTAEAEEKRKFEIMYVKEASAKLKRMMGNISDKDAKKKVEQVYDIVNSSPVKSHPNISQMEKNIMQSINELEEAVTDGKNDAIISLANMLLTAVDERNMRLKNLN
jgi:hypothetical protein